MKAANDANGSIGVIRGSVLGQGCRCLVQQISPAISFVDPKTKQAPALNEDTDTVYKELAASLVANSHLVTAGIVAVARAQERGYAFVRA